MPSWVPNWLIARESPKNLHKLPERSIAVHLVKAKPVHSGVLQLTLTPIGLGLESDKSSQADMLAIHIHRPRSELDAIVVLGRDTMTHVCWKINGALSSSQKALYG